MSGLIWKAAAYRFLDTFILIFPFYTVMFAERGLSPAEIGLALAAWSGTGLVLEIPTGVLADRFSRRWLLFAAQLIRGIGFAIWVLVPSFWGFLVGLMLWGAKTALVSGTFEALIFDELKAAGRATEYARAIGHSQTGRFAGLMAASLLAAAIAGIGYPALTAISAATAVLAALAALALPPAPRAVTAHPADHFAHVRQGIREAVRRPGVLPVLSFIAAMQALLAACEDYWQIFGREVGLNGTQIALFVAAMSAAQALGSALSHRAPLAPPAALHGLVGLGGVLLFSAAALFQPASVILAVGFTGLCRLADVRADARFQHALSGAARATVASVKGFASQTATTVLILAFGLLAQQSSYRMAFLTFGVALTVLGLGYAASAVRTLPARQPP